MKDVIINSEPETMADDVFVRTGLRRCRHQGHEFAAGCGQVQIVSVDDPYYRKARRFPNSHLVYLNPYAGDAT